ncbi:hypothetical protein VTP01DRAFT_268 [Rhizomucor pusillus]|uniref:uncharacterized protein n=1 Tax=Rhizomucor pusillus TaxID=4840 RepID=UPI003741E96C
MILFSVQTTSILALLFSLPTSFRNRSRIIVKNLPKYLTEEQLKDHFAAKGQVTDAKLMRTSDGKSRRFGFVGYKDEKSAQEAIEYFNNSFIDTSRISVSKALPKGADGLPRPWSKYSAGSTAYQKVHEQQQEKQDKKKNEFEVVETDAYREKQKKLEEHIKKLHADENDPKLREYLDVMTSRSKGKTWTNDDLAVLKESDYDQEITASGVKKLNIQDQDSDVDSASDAEPMDEDKPEEEQQRESAANGESFKSPEEQIEDTGRLFVRNLAYACTEQDLKDLFSKYGPLSEVHMPISKETKRPKGFAYILYLLPEHAIKAYKELDNSPFLGRLLHILPAKEKPQAPEEEPVGPNGIKLSKFKKEKEQKRKNLAGSEFNWNSLYMSADAVVEAIAERLGVTKAEILNAESDNMAVRLALAETQIVNETKEFFERHGIILDANGRKERSDTVILVKNVPFGTMEQDMRDLFKKFGELGRVLVPPAKTMAVVEFLEPSEARAAFKSMAYRRYKDSLLYLEKAPSGFFKTKFDPNAQKQQEQTKDEPKVALSSSDLLESSETDAGNADTATLFVKNLNFATKPDGLKKAFEGIKGYRSSRINVKPDPNHPGKMLSMGYGFIEFDSEENASNALKAMQGYTLDGHALQLKFSHHKAGTGASSSKSKSSKSDTTKLVVRNVPFEATSKDLKELFSTYGKLKSLRLPKKFNGGHRGFAFLDFMTHQEAQNVYDSMNSIHLYGRHLVLEWAQDDDNIDALREKTGRDFAKEENLERRKRAKVEI